ncbi:uncharacterized protein J3R85_006329 [Psidium guajava]|nr:uncharacterized protein J3R85_006329 [Psidium guajava]
MASDVKTSEFDLGTDLYLMQSKYSYLGGKLRSQGAKYVPYSSSRRQYSAYLRPDVSVPEPHRIMK